MREKTLALQIAALIQERDALYAALDDVIRSYEKNKAIEDKYLNMAKLTLLKSKAKNVTQPNHL